MVDGGRPVKTGAPEALSGRKPGQVPRLYLEPGSWIKPIEALYEGGLSDEDISEDGGGGREPVVPPEELSECRAVMMLYASDGSTVSKHAPLREFTT